MARDGSIWNKNNSAWRDLNDSATVSWDFTTNRDTATANVVDGSVTLAKLANMSTDRLLGRDTASSGPPEEVALSTGLTFTGGPGIALADTAVTPGTYTGQFTVDQQGRITAASNAAVPGWIKLVTTTVSTSTSTLDIILTAYTAYPTLCFVLRSVRPGTDDTQMYMRFSTNAGGAYDASASNYIYAVGAINQAESTITDASSGATQIGISSNDASGMLSSDAGAGFDAVIYMHNWTSATLKTRVHWTAGYISTGPGAVAIFGTGHRTTAQDTDAVRFLQSSGNYASYIYSVYGLL